MENGKNVELDENKEAEDFWMRKYSSFKNHYLQSHGGRCTCVGAELFICVQCSSCIAAA